MNKSFFDDTLLGGRLGNFLLEESDVQDEGGFLFHYETLFGTFVDQGGMFLETDQKIDAGSLNLSVPGSPGGPLSVEDQEALDVFANAYVGTNFAEGYGGMTGDVSANFSMNGEGVLEDPASGSGDYFGSFSSDHYPTLEFGELAMLGDRVWEDLDADGNQDTNPDGTFSEPGINDVEVKLLTDPDGDGVFDNVVDTMTTGVVVDADGDGNLDAGTYKFNGLTPGVEYVVMFNNPDDVGPDAYMFSPQYAPDGTLPAPNPATDSNADPNAGPNLGMTEPVVLSSGEFNQTLDAGLFRKGSIHVFGYLDKDGDGNFDPEDGAFPDDPGKMFELLDDNGDVIMTDSTEDGMVWFEQLVPGTYSVRENPIPAGFDLTTVPNERTFTIISGQELVYEDGAAMLPNGDQRFETNLGDELRWGNALIPEPEIDLEKFTRVDVNPIDIEKLVRVQSPAIEGDVCEVLDKPMSLTFQYIPSVEFNPLQPSGKAGVLENNGLDDDDTAYVVVSKNGDTSNFGDIFFEGNVSENETFTAAGSFGSNTYFFFFDELGGPLLQSFHYHTSCSAPIILGAQPLSATLVGYNDGTPGGNIEAPDFGPGINDADADTPTGPTATPGDTVVFTFVVTNPIPDSQLSNVTVTDQLLAPVDPPDVPVDLPNPVPVEEGGFNVGDTDMDNELDGPSSDTANDGEVWLYTATVGITSATAPAQYVDKATVVGIPVDDNSDPIGGQAMDMDPAHYIVAADPPVQGDVCDVLGKAHTMTFIYTGQGDDVITGQDPGKANATGDPMGASPVLIRVTDKSDPTDAGGRIYFQGTVNVGEDFVATATPGATSFKSQTFFHIFDAGTDSLLQTGEYHTSCSQPIQLGDVIGAVTLVGYEGGDGTSLELPPPTSTASPINSNSGGIMFTTDDPFDPEKIGEDADDPTGPSAQPGNKITWTYKVTNTGNVALTITSLFDDNETEPLPPGAGADDFEPVPVLVEVPATSEEFFNFGDTNTNNLFDPTEMWYFQAMEIATETGQHKNTAEVTAKDYSGTGVMDLDMSHYIINPLDIEKLVRVAEPTHAGDVCDVLGKPVEMTFDYIPGTSVITGQNDASATGTPDNDGESFIVVTDRHKVSDVLDGDGEVYFSDDVFFTEVFTASAANAGVDRFRSNTFIYIFDDQGAFEAGDDPLQTMRYHTSCSQPIQLGDVIGSVTLVGYVGENGSAAGDDLGPGVGDDDADLPTGPAASPGDTVVFTYVVTNQGVTPLSGAIANVVVTDQELVPAEGPEFNPDPVLDDDGFNVGDTDQDNQLDTGEKWLYTSTMDITDATPLGQHTDEATVFGNPVVNDFVQNDQLNDMDPANFVVVEEPAFVGDVCDVLGKPVELTFEYQPGSTVWTGGQGNNQDGKATATGTPDNDNEAYIVVTDKSKVSDVLQGKGIAYFGGTVMDDGNFTASATDAGENKFKSNTFIYVFEDATAFDSGENPLQTMTYHTSCSKPIQLDDLVGSVTLVGYVGEDGSASALRTLDVGGEVTRTSSPTPQAIQDALTSGIRYWQAAGVDGACLQVLEDAQVSVEPLAGSFLGLAYGRNDIVIDDDAAGYGWSTDVSGDGVDLLSVVTHELGHLLGLGHDQLGMDTLEAGVRQLPQPAQAGDANRDGFFDRLDLVQVLQSGKYATDQPAGWNEGDWNRDGQFDRDDLMTALRTGDYDNHHQGEDLGETDAVFAQLGGDE